MFSGRMRIIAAAAAAGLLAAGCGSQGGAASAGPQGDEKITLSLNLFGQHGLQGALRRIRGRTPEHQDRGADLRLQRPPPQPRGPPRHRQRRRRHRGDRHRLHRPVPRQPQHFTDLNQHGAAQPQGRWLPWKWEASLAKTGAQIGSAPTSAAWPCATAATCSRRPVCPPTATRCRRCGPTGRPTSRPARSTPPRSPTAPRSSTGRAGRSTRSSASPGRLLRHDDKVVVDDNPAVRKAYDQVAEGRRPTASRPSSSAVSPAWNTGFAKSQFATIACPAWMLAYIQDQAKDVAGQVGRGRDSRRRRQLGRLLPDRPGPGQARQGGRGAVAWLTAPEQQIKVFSEHGTCPSTVAPYEEPEVTGLTNPFFNDAPIGKIFPTAAPT